MKSGQYIRHGDLLLQKLDDKKIGEDQYTKKEDNLVLLEGEATGHAHRLIGEAILRGFMLYVYKNSILTHEEHGPIPIPYGTYIMRQQREYVPNSHYVTRPVRD